MLNVAARATKGITLPTRKATRNAIIRAFHDNIKALRKELSVRSIISFTVGSTYHLFFRARKRDWSAWPVMRGRRVTMMLTLRSLGTGWSSTAQPIGSTKVQSSDLLRWILLTTVCVSGEHYSRLCVALDLLIRYVINSSKLSYLISWGRLAGLHVTMPRTTSQCSSILRNFSTNCKNLVNLNGIGLNAISGSCLCLSFILLQTVLSHS